MHEQTSGRGTAGAWLWASVGGIACGAMALLEPNLLEEGMMLHVGERLLAGEHLYRDLRLFTGPLPFAVTALGFAVFGKTLLAARTGVVVLQAAACAAVFAMARRSGVGAWAHAAAACLALAPVLLFPLLSTQFYTTVATSLAFVVAWLALRGVDSSRWALAAGAGIAAVALCKQTIGVALLATLGPALLLCAPRDARRVRGVALVGGGATVTLATLAFFAALGDLEVFVASLVELPRGETFGQSFINLWPPGRLSPSLHQYQVVPQSIFLLGDERPRIPPVWIFVTQLLYALPFAAFGCSLFVRLRRPLAAGAWMLLGVLAAHATNLYPRADSGHLTFVVPAALASLLVALPRPGPARRPRLRATLAWGVVLGLVAASGPMAAYLYDRSVEPAWGPRIDVRPVSMWNRGDAMPRVIGFLRERLEPGEAIFVARSEPLVYFATGARNPTPFTGALQVWGVRGGQQQEILEALRGVRFVVVTDVDSPLGTYFRNELPDVQAYLERHFRVPALFQGRGLRQSWILVLERGLDRGPTAVDLLDAIGEASFWRRNADGSTAPLELDPELLPPRFLGNERAPGASGGAGPLARLPSTLPTRHNRRPLPLPLTRHGSGVDYRLTMPEGARFEAGVGFRSIGTLSSPSGTTFRLAVRREEEPAGDFEALGSWRIDHLRASRRAFGLAWEPVVVDLSRYAGQQVTLRLEVTPPRSPKGGRWAFWGSPRIAPAAAPELGTLE